MTKIELNEEQRKALIDIINNSNFRGADVEFISDLKRAIQSPIE